MPIKMVQAKVVTYNNKSMRLILKSLCGSFPSTNPTIATKIMEPNVALGTGVRRGDKNNNVPQTKIPLTILQTGVLAPAESETALRDRPADMG